MEVSPLFRTANRFMTVCGVRQTPFKNMFGRALYTIYSNLNYLVFGTYPLFRIISTPSVIKNHPQEILNHLETWMMYCTVAMKLHLVRPVKVTHLVNYVMGRENEIAKDEDEEVISMYNKSVKVVTRLAMSFSVWYISTTVMYTVRNIIWLIMDSQNPADNSTRLLPERIWVPFDTNGFLYIPMCIGEIWQCLFLGVVMSAADGCFFAMMVYCVLELRIIKRKFQQVDADEVDVDGQLSSMDEHEVFKMVSVYANRHQNLIKFVADFDEIMKVFMFMDFLSLSALLAAITYEFLQPKKAFETFFLFTFLVTVSVQFLLYWYANELLLESMELGTTIYNTKWYNRSEKVKKLLWLVMMRTDRPLTLHILSLTDMSNEILIKSVKAVFSMMTFIRNFTE